MFLGARSTQAEYFDSERSPQEVAAFFRTLARVNRLFVFAEPFQRFLPNLVQNCGGCRSLSILDLGAGDGSLGRSLSAWANRQNWQWRITNLDFNLSALRLCPDGQKVTASVLALPFRDSSFDVVVVSQMTHHLGDRHARAHLQEAWRVARRGILLSDLHRNIVLYATLWCVCRVLRAGRSFREDALLSVRRGWRVPELQKLAAQAGIPHAKVNLYFGARILLLASKPNGDNRARGESQNADSPVAIG